MSHRQCITRLLDLHGISYCLQDGEILALEPIAHALGEWHVFGPLATLGDVRRWLGY